MPQQFQKRRAALRVRVESPDHMYSYCRVVGCGRPASAGTTEGLNRRFCRKHEEHYERHGSPYKGTYKAALVAPHRAAADAWLQANEGAAAVRQAVLAVDALYRSAGPRLGAHRMAGKTREERARAIWACLREKRTAMVDVVAVWLSVEATVLSDPQAEAKQEFRRVQAAKIIHRMAGGEHKRWDREATAGRVVTTEMHKYTHSRGRILRHLGEQLQAAADGAAVRFLREAGYEA